MSEGRVTAVDDHRPADREPWYTLVLGGVVVLAILLAILGFAGWAAFYAGRDLWDRRSQLDYWLDTNGIGYAAAIALTAWLTWAVATNVRKRP